MKAIKDGNIDEFINSLEEEGSKKQFRNWLPVTLLAAMIFPVWGELVGYCYNLINIKGATVFDGIKRFIELIPYAIYLFFFIWFIAYEFEKLLLSEVKGRKKLIKILRLIKING